MESNKPFLKPTYYNSCNKCERWNAEKDKPRNKLYCLLCDGRCVEHEQPLDKSKQI